ncbi:hypothetical protein ACTJJB_23545 [Chitinophaga sp. 22536]|uniref:hypothetical protein n=1 Tax=unclassified Chitinophaga TaxID=2619133 RepID=UPI003F86A169
MKLSLSKLLLLALLAGSCKKDHHGKSAGPDTEAVKREPGLPMGVPVSKTIGPEGGTLLSGDNHMLVTIPERAVTMPVAFSIQQVTNTLNDGTGARSFRLQPEGVRFEKPIKLEYDYSGVDLSGTAPAFLYLTYQDKDGYYWLVRNTQLDTSNKVLSTETTHFSDWTICEYFQVQADKTTVPYGGKANLKLMWYDFSKDDLAAPLVKDIKLPPLTSYKPDEVSTITWTMPAGEGSLNFKDASCTYTAANSEPVENPAMITANIKNLIWNGQQHDRLAYGALLMLTTPVYIGSDQYVQYYTGGDNYLVTGDCVSGCISHEINDNFYLKATQPGNRFLEIKIPAGSGKGAYRYGDTNGTAQIIEGTGTTNNDQRYHTSYLPCTGCNSAFSPGTVNITRFDTSDGYVEGSFSATLYLWTGALNPPHKAITGRFRFKK